MSVLAFTSLGSFTTSLEPCLWVVVLPSAGRFRQCSAFPKLSSLSCFLMLAPLGSGSEEGVVEILVSHPFSCRTYLWLAVVKFPLQNELSF